MLSQELFTSFRRQVTAAVNSNVAGTQRTHSVSIRPSSTEVVPLPLFPMKGMTAASQHAGCSQWVLTGDTPTLVVLASLQWTGNYKDNTHVSGFQRMASGHDALLALRAHPVGMPRTPSSSASEALHIPSHDWFHANFTQPDAKLVANSGFKIAKAPGPDLTRMR